MKKAKKKNTYKIRIDKSVGNYADSPFVQEKLAKANETIRKYGLPKEFYDKK